MNLLKQDIEVIDASLLSSWQYIKRKHSLANVLEYTDFKIIYLWEILNSKTNFITRITEDLDTVTTWVFKNLEPGTMPGKIEIREVWDD